MSRKTALVVAPGRGTYNKTELGYLRRLHAGASDLIARFDARRTALGQDTLTALDGADRYRVSRFSRGDNASALIYGCAYADFQSIDRDAFDIVAVTGNSMGWYIALACAEALDAEGGFDVVNTMGTLMHAANIGGQMLYPFVDANWQPIPGRFSELIALTETIPDLYASIYLGGMLVFAGSDKALAELDTRLEPVQARFPMRLAYHGGFHSPLQRPVSDQGLAQLPLDLFSNPKIPLIDGRGHIWHPYGTVVDQLRDYTLRDQVLTPYDFTRAVQNGVKEFAPDVIIILGPGNTLGGGVAQSLIQTQWQGLRSKQDFKDRQQADPFVLPIVLSMSLDDQRRLITA